MLVFILQIRIHQNFISESQNRNPIIKSVQNFAKFECSNPNSDHLLELLFGMKNFLRTQWNVEEKLVGGGFALFISTQLVRLFFTNNDEE